MTATLTFHPLGDADCTRIDLADGRQMLVDYADMRNDDDFSDKRCDLATLLKADLRNAKRNGYDVVMFTHLDDDHCCGAANFFWLEHAAKHQGVDRPKIAELWVPAAAITEDGLTDSARIIRQEARHRLKAGKGIRVFSRPERLQGWFDANGISLESRAHLITDAGGCVPGFSKFGAERSEFFIHSPHAWRQNDNKLVDRNQDSIVFQATFLEGGRETYALFMSDIDHESIAAIVDTTTRHGNAHRLLWDIFKIPHHCSYKSIGPEKGDAMTAPVPQMAWLCETQGRAGATMMSTSRSMPTKGTPEDIDVQPPHRQAGAYYQKVAYAFDGYFKVVMDLPSRSNPKPSQIEITERGARLLLVSASVGVASVVSTPARAG